MKRIIFALAATVFLGPAARSEAVLAGYLATPVKTWLVLVDTEKKSESTTISVGDRFGGFTVAAFDERTEEAILNPVGGGAAVKLTPDRSGQGRVVLAGRLAIENGPEIAVRRASFRIGEPTRIPLQDGPDGLVFILRPTQAEDGSMKYSVMIERIEKGRKEVFTGRLARVPQGAPFSGQSGPVMYQFKPQ